MHLEIKNKNEQLTELNKLEENATKEHLDTIMRMNPDAMSTFRLNVTGNICNHGSSRYRNLLMLQEKGTIDGYVEDALSLFPYEKERAEFCSLFYRDHLLHAFEQGKIQIELKHHYMITEKKMSILKTIVNLAKNNVTGDIVGVVYTLDITEQERNANTLRILFDREYEGRGIINVKNKTYTLSRFEYEPEVVASSVDMDYQAGVQRLASKFVWEEEREEYCKKVALEKLVSELDQNGSYSFTATYKGKNGEKRYKKIFYYYLDEFHDEIFSVTEDITDLTCREQEQIQKMRETMLEAEKANEAKTTFLSSISHDLRTPLNSVLGFTALAKETEDDATRRSYLDKVSESGELLLGLINDTLSISKIETGKMTLEYQNVNANTFLDSMVDLLQSNAATKNIQTEINISEYVKKPIKMDVLRTKQIYMNILSNAIKFTPENGLIQMEVEYVGETDFTLKTKTVIRDNGVGMSAEFLPHIFDSFTQESAQKNGNFAGTGLGMAITKGLVNLMGGSIEVKSALGKGTEFTVYLDYEKVGSAVYKDNRPLEDYSVLQGKHVLYCEDHPLNRELGIRILEKYGICVDTAENGKIGVDMFQTSQIGFYDAILMDVRMPEMDGLQATRTIRALTRDDGAKIPIIAMTANAYDEERKETLESGMSGHIGKPVNVRELCGILAKQIAEYRNR